jgi:ribonuclease VapC
MILDTSAIIAILQNEPESEGLISAMQNAKMLRISAASVVEAGIVMYSRYGDAGELEVDQFIHRLNISIVPVTAEQAELARSGYRKYGKGIHPAGLNFGDCFSYALAISLQEKLLFVGEDFSKTDVEIA